MSDLALVMPVYNEEGCIARVVRAWHDALSRTGADFRMIVLNDGSTDGTRQALDDLGDLGGLEVVHKANSGHGPTVLEGYRRAVAEATWVFQTDSDDEMKPSHFAELWREREGYDALLGERTGREQVIDRRAISAVSRCLVRMVFGSGVRDVNVPYRLMRSAILRPIVERLPNDTLTPNIIISGALNRSGARILNLPVPHEARATGRGSLGGWKLWRFAFKAFWQCLRRG